MLAEHGALPLERAVDVIRQVGEALDYAHDGLAIHRDIKPGNMMLRPDGRAKVLDFGLARLMSHSQYKASTRVGSVAYMAPEQFEGATGLNTDLWALGITFFQLATNVLPFPARDEASLVHQILVRGSGSDSRRRSRLRPAAGPRAAQGPGERPGQAVRRAAEFCGLAGRAPPRGLAGHIEGNLEIHLRAHFPLIYLHTHEEDRALAALGRVRDVMAADRPLDLLLWSETRGLRDAHGQWSPGRAAGTPSRHCNTPSSRVRRAIYVFLDIHRHFTPVTVRLVRDCIWTVKRQRKSLVFVSPDVASAGGASQRHDAPLLRLCRT